MYLERGLSWVFVVGATVRTDDPGLRSLTRDISLSTIRHVFYMVEALAGTKSAGGGAPARERGWSGPPPWVAPLAAQAPARPAAPPAADGEFPVRSGEPSARRPTPHHPRGAHRSWGFFSGTWSGRTSSGA